MVPVLSKDIWELVTESEPSCELARFPIDPAKLVFPLALATANTLWEEAPDTTKLLISLPKVIFPKPVAPVESELFCTNSIGAWKPIFLPPVVRMNAALVPPSFTVAPASLLSCENKPEIFTVSWSCNKALFKMLTSPPRTPFVVTALRVISLPALTVVRLSALLPNAVLPPV